MFVTDIKYLGKVTTEYLVNKFKSIFVKQSDFDSAQSSLSTAITNHTNIKSGNPHGVTAEMIEAVPNTRTINGKRLNQNVTLKTADLENNSGYVTANELENKGYITTDKDTTYTISADGKNIVLTDNDGNTSTVEGVIYSHPTTSGNKHIPSGGSSGQILRWSAAGTAKWGNDNNTEYDVFSTSEDGLAPKSDGSTTKYLRADGTWVTPTDTKTFTITAEAEDDNVVNLTGTNGTNSVSYKAEHALKGPSQSSNTTKGALEGSEIKGSGASGTIKVPKLTVDKYGHTTGLTDYELSIEMPTIPDKMENPYALTIGGKTYDGSGEVEVTLEDLGLSSAMKFLGTTTTTVADGYTTNPVTIGSKSVSVTSGNVILYGSKEFVWNGSAWEELGNEGSYKIEQEPVNSPSASGNATSFIDTIQQDAQGVITATKKNIPTAGTSFGMVKSGGDATISSGVITISALTNKSAKGHTHSVSHTPDGTVEESSPKPTGAVTSDFDGTPAEHDHGFTGTAATISANYTPKGSVSSNFTGTPHEHTFSGTSVNTGKSSTGTGETIAVHSLTSVGSKPTATFTQGELPSATFSAGSKPAATLNKGTYPALTFNAGVFPTLTGSVSNQCLTLTYGAGTLPSASLSAGTLPSLTFSAGTLPSLTFNAGELPTLAFNAGATPSYEEITLPTTSHKHAVTAQGTVQAATAGGSVTSGFTGTAATISASYTPEGTVAKKSITPAGTITSTFAGDTLTHTHTFAGTPATITTSADS